MTDAQEEQAIVQSENSQQANVNNRVGISETQATQESAQEQSPVLQEKMIPQSQVNEIVSARLKKERESYAKAAPQFQQNNTQQNFENSGLDISNEVDKRLQEIEQARQNEIAIQEARKTLDSLTAKIDEASKKYEDFEEVTKDVPFASFPGLLTAANSVENAGDVLYHLGKHPSKMREMASSFQPVIDPQTGRQVVNPMAQIAMKELKELSVTMRNNEFSKQKNYPSEPLRQISPSNVNADNGQPSVKELRKKWTV